MGEFAHLDVVVIGAGPAGLAAALACRKSGFDTVVAGTSKTASAEASKGRSAALFNQSVAFLQEIGVWEACSNSAEPLRVLQFIDDTGRLFRAPDCAFHAREIEEAVFGYNISNWDLSGGLRAEAKRQQIPILEPGRLTALDYEGSKARALFEDGTELRAPLIIAGDGRKSATREAAGIRTVSWSYGQTAIGASFYHERLHNGICIEFHRAGGPLTLIPLPGNRSSLVWSERSPEAERLLSLDDGSFVSALEEASHFVLGRVSNVSERGGFRLSALFVREYGRSRSALVGEAAHAAPPIGAQGLNLGLRDVEALVGLIGKAKENGEDIGSDKLLRTYSASRRGDVVSRTLGLDLLNRSVLSGFLPLQAARGLGLYALGTVGPLRRAFMRRGIAPAR